VFFIFLSLLLLKVCRSCFRCSLFFVVFLSCFFVVFLLLTVFIYVCFFFTMFFFFFLVLLLLTRYRTFFFYKAQRYNFSDVLGVEEKVDILFLETVEHYLLF